MKLRIISTIFLLIASFANADDVDIEGLCNLDIESEKIYSSIPEDELNNLISMFESLKTLSELGKITGHNYHDTVATIEKYRIVDKPEAELIVLNMHKNIEIARMKKAIELRAVDDPEKWEKEFEKCVFEGRNRIDEKRG